MVGPKEGTQATDRAASSRAQTQKGQPPTSTASILSVDEGRKGRTRPGHRTRRRDGNPSHRAVRLTDMNPRDFRKAAPYLGALLLAAVVFIVVRSLL